MEKEMNVNKFFRSDKECRNEDLIMKDRENFLEKELEEIIEILDKCHAVKYKGSIISFFDEEEFSDYKVQERAGGLRVQTDNEIWSIDREQYNEIKKLWDSKETKRIADII